METTLDLNSINDKIISKEDASKIVEEALYKELHKLINDSEQMKFLHNHIEFLLAKAGLLDEIVDWEIEVTLNKK